MKVIPYRSMDIVVPKPPDQVAEQLAAKVEPWRWVRWRFPREHLPFMGKVNADGFMLAVVPNYHDVFRPILYGRFEPTAEGTLVRVRMMPHPLPLGLAGLMIGVLIMSASLPWQLLREGGSPAPLILVSLVILGTVAMVPLGFWWEVPEVQRLFEESLGLKEQGT